jgi:MFS family permease
MSFADSSLLTTIINAVGLPTRVLIPFVADRIGPLNTIAPAGLCVAIMAYTWLAVHNVAGVYVFSIFYGIASGAFQSLMPTGVASITTRLDTIGTRMGMCFSLISFAGLSGPPIGGLLQSQSLVGAHVWAALSSSLAAVLLVLARVLKVGWKVKIRC